MKVIITGATGFVGSRFLKSIVAVNRHEIAVLGRNLAKTSHIAVEFCRIRVISGDLFRLGDCVTEIERFCPDAIVHLAWHGVLGRHRNDLGQWRNVTATMELLEVARRLGVKHFVGIGSQAEYGPCTSRVTENTSTHPTTLYGAAKLAAGLLADAYCQQAGMRYAWLRLFSSYGPGDSSEWLIPSLMLKLLRGERPSVTNAEQLWDFLYVDDVADALLRVLERPQATGVFNLGSGRALPLRFVIESIRDMIDPRLAIGFGEIPYRPDQVMHLEASTERLERATAWQPATSLATGLRATLEWYREHA